MNLCFPFLLGRNFFWLIRESVGHQFTTRAVETFLIVACQVLGTRSVNGYQRVTSVSLEILCGTTWTYFLKKYSNIIINVIIKISSYCRVNTKLININCTTNFLSTVQWRCGSPLPTQVAFIAHAVFFIPEVLYMNLLNYISVLRNVLFL